MSWLAPVRAVLDAAATPRQVFFRDDDAGWDDPRLLALLDVFERSGVELDVAVIPMELRAPLVRELRDRARSAGVRLHQHGYAHINHEPNGRKYEFGPSRDVRDQAVDIANGQQRMRDAFDDLVDPIFTPPWNRCTSDTGAVLPALGLTVISCDSTASPQRQAGLTEVPITVDWFGHDKGVRWTRADVGHRIAAGLCADAALGVMLHHAITDEAERTAVSDLVELLAGHPRARTTTIRDAAGLPAER